MQKVNASALPAGSLFEVSKLEDGNTFSSKSVELSSLTSKISAETETGIANAYCLKDDDGNKLNLSSINNTVNSIANSDFAFNGIKQFKQWTWISADFPGSTDTTYAGIASKHFIPNIEKVNELISLQPVYFSTDDSYVAEGNPLPAQGNSSIDSSVPVSLSYA